MSLNLTHHPEMNILAELPSIPQIRSPALVVTSRPIRSRTCFPRDARLLSLIQQILPFAQHLPRGNDGFQILYAIT